MRTDRQKDLDTYYNDHLKMHIIRRLQLIDTWAEIKAIEAAVYEALQREDDAEKKEQQDFKEWKKNHQSSLINVPNQEEKNG